MFGEKYIKGTFLKWNNNTGYVNTEDGAKENQMDKLVEVFCHYTWQASRGRLIVVDIQGWSTRDPNGSRRIVFTDPQVHTTVPGGGNNQREDVLFRRFSFGNLGKIGMTRFFQSHVCSHHCRVMGCNMPIVNLRGLGVAHSRYSPKRSV